MAGAEIDIKSLLEQDRSTVLEVLETSRKLIFEVKAAHYWITHSIEVFTQLRNIGQNLSRLTASMQPHWGEGKLAFNRADGMKLWQTAFGLWRALPPVRAKFIEQLAKRRRERIMGQGVVEPEELDPAKTAEDMKRYQELFEELMIIFAGMNSAIQVIPAGLAPILEIAPPGVNGQAEGVPSGAEVIQGGAPQQQPAPAPDKPAAPVDGDDLAPV